MLRSLWSDHRTTLLRLAVVLMAVVALVWLGYEFWRLLWGSSPIWHTSPSGAVDLKQFHTWIHRWFAGERVYEIICTYPPASHVILWPLLGWLALTPARWLWAVTTVIALGWLIYLIVQESGADTPLERTFVALMPLSMYATGATIGNGQLIVHFLPMLMVGLFLLLRGRGGGREDLLAAVLLLATLVKPSVSLPFFWMVLFVPGRLRPALLVAFGYVALTLFAASFQEPELLTLLHGWLTAASAVVTGTGQVHLHIWLASLGLEEWIFPAGILVLAALGFWTYRHRHRDLWLLLGVTAFVARFWTYHGWYDDLLILLPMIALFRIAKQGSSADGSDVVAGVLLVITLLTTLAPGGLYLFPSPWNTLYVAGQAFVWIVVLIFLLDQARREKLWRLVDTSIC
jgi:hypothetical protein